MSLEELVSEAWRRGDDEEAAFLEAMARKLQESPAKPGK